MYDFRIWTNLEICRWKHCWANLEILSDIKNPWEPRLVMWFAAHVPLGHRVQDQTPNVLRLCRTVPRCVQNWYRVGVVTEEHRYNGRHQLLLQICPSTLQHIRYEFCYKNFIMHGRWVSAETSRYMEVVWGPNINNLLLSSFMLLYCTSILLFLVFFNMLYWFGKFKNCRKRPTS